MGDSEVPGRGLTRRAVLRDGSAVALAVLASGGGSAFARIGVAVKPGAPVFLTKEEMRALRGLVDLFIPDDGDPGALAAGCAEAIDALLGAFRVDPPLIYAGAPFSDRAGSEVNHFEEFLPLDRYERKAWRLRIVGSRGRRALEFNGPVKGFQAIYRDGLAALDEAAGGDGFAALSLPERDLIVRTSDDPAIAEIVDIAFPHTYEFMYGAPEYGGNRDLVGWEYTNYAGDVQPRGWTRKQIEQPDASGGRAADPGTAASTPLKALIALAPLASAENMHQVVARSGGRLSGLRAELAPVIDAAKLDRDDLEDNGEPDGT